MKTVTVEIRESGDEDIVLDVIVLLVTDEGVRQESLKNNPKNRLVEQ